MHAFAAGDRILGVDPGLNVTGYGVVEVVPGGIRLAEAGVIRGTASRGLDGRLQQIHAGLVEVLQTFQPVAISLEELYSHYDRPRTAILMGHARGVICLAAAQAQIPLFHYGATHVKKLLTGNGRAPKGQVQWAICREFALRQPPEPPDVADALALALCHLYQNTQIESLKVRPPAKFKRKDAI
ncbi:MAG: crossover junction endodeoxyribonuclease RuvC [Pirellulaceae bacterium]|nr:crossover junction endodeoxyribonuclease RuvC [Pirellulaceae bacterium]